MKLSEIKLRSQGKTLVKAPIRGVAKIGRNDLCICGSKMKFKFCCWSKYTGNLGEKE
ncbi:SEC-C domain-containing protein [Candidatus Pacearchaeota archaeon]|nr:SEC-C domain-containing protein [Candidatus Pacearchaeota archaeon]